MADSVQGTRLKKFKNSLDSDEDDDEEESTKYNVLNPEDLEGEEEATIDRDGEIQITPFNMKEELEEGHFDKEGTYIFHKEQNVINDQWLDNIDWVKVKTGGDIKRKRKDSLSSDSDDLPELNVIDHYKEMIKIMKPHETVQKAIRRLGGGKSRTASSRWKKSKEKAGDESSTDEDYEKLQKLTGLASDLLQTGNMDIYEQSYECLKFLVDKSDTSGSRSGSKISLSEDVDEALDMFGENFDETASGSNTSAKHGEGQNGSAAAEDSSISEVMWDFKWENKDSSPVYGPNSTSDMLRWVQEGYFADGVWVRQVGKADSNFYSSKRIDFELYL